MLDTDRRPSRSSLSPLLEVVVGTPRSHEMLTVIPLFCDSSANLPHVLLTEALASGMVTIGEIGSGSVPSLLASNRGKRTS